MTRPLRDVDAVGGCLAAVIAALAFAYLLVTLVAALAIVGFVMVTAARGLWWLVYEDGWVRSAFALFVVAAGWIYLVALLRRTP